MLDFLMVVSQDLTKDKVVIFPKFIVRKSDDLMIRGSDFYAIWDDDNQMWSTDPDVANRLIDREVDAFADSYRKEHPDKIVNVLHMWDGDSGMVDKWIKYCTKQQRGNMYHPLDERLIFSNTPTTRKDYASKRLPYPLEEGSIENYDELMSTLYSPTERQKIEWCIGAIVDGASRDIQKFIVMYGPPGSGKSTVMNLVQCLFDGYYSSFDARALGNPNSSFALEPFRTNPLVAIQHDGDLSRIEDNTRLNSIVSHEEMTVNEKFRSAYSSKFQCFLFMGTNKPVKITDARSGILRRLIDVSPTGKKVPARRYHDIFFKATNFELGAIASHCLSVYRDDPHMYDDYVPTQMLGASNDFYNFVLDSFETFASQNGTTLKAAWEMYKSYCEDAKVPYPYSQRVFKEELKNYFANFEERKVLDGETRVRNYYDIFLADKFEAKESTSPKPTDISTWIHFKKQHSLFDDIAAGYFAQLASPDGIPLKAWDEVTTTLSDISTDRLHYVLFGDVHHIVIDFDIKDENGNKCLALNLKAASKWPKTYAELSKSGQGIHLHYIYDGDVSRLSRVYAEDIEVKVFSGKQSLRRCLTECNDIPIATINSGLPLKGETKVINHEAVKSEKGLRNLIVRNLRKEIHPGTKPSVEFIHKILEDAYDSGLHYDVTDMRPDITAFAMHSTNHSNYCVKKVSDMKFRSEDASENVEQYDDDTIIFFDVEVFPNLFVIVWKAVGEDSNCVTMINPTPAEVENLLKFKLVGFNNRKYDNHILYARLLGYSEERLYEQSQRIISGSRNAFFQEAYNLSYADIYDFSSVKQSLKKFEIELHIHHQELRYRWDEPVPEEKWKEVAEYCKNDVIATEAVFNARQQDFIARKILADISGLTVNDTTRMHATRIIFGTEKHPELVYTDLRDEFPGYSHGGGHSKYRGEDPGEGGYVYAEPGMYSDVALLDIASMHPSTIRRLNLFGNYTKRYTDIVDARLAIKHKDFETAGTLLNGAFKRYLDDPEKAKDLAQALKIVINSVYGYTTATFDNPFKDSRNIDNIVAKRGALFMINLKHEVQARGFTVAHIKTDSIKIPNATPDIIQFVMEYGKKYGYNFEHEATYKKMCLVNDAVYIAQYNDGHWDATGAQFAVPYVFKTLFSKESLVFDDYCETKSVKTALYLDMNEMLPDVTEYEVELDKLKSKFKKGKVDEESYATEVPRLEALISEGHNYQFVGRVGRFCPMKSGTGGGILLREATTSDGTLKYSAATGSKGYRWMESEMVETLGKFKDIDDTIYRKLVDDAVASISEYGDFEWFVSA